MLIRSHSSLSTTVGIISTMPATTVYLTSLGVAIANAVVYHPPLFAYLKTVTSVVQALQERTPKRLEGRFDIATSEAKTAKQNKTVNEQFNDQDASRSTSRCTQNLSRQSLSFLDFSTRRRYEECLKI